MRSVTVDDMRLLDDREWEMRGMSMETTTYRENLESTTVDRGAGGVLTCFS